MPFSNSYEVQQDVLTADVFSEPLEYAGFWLRFAANVIDIIIGYAAAFLALIPFYVIDSTPSRESSGAYEFLMLGLFIAMVLYYPLMESSAWQATLGKRAVGIKVTDVYLQRISFGKALARLFAKMISAMILYIGFLMAGFTKQKQGLHDLIAETLVIKS